MNRPFNGFVFGLGAVVVALFALQPKAPGQADKAGAAKRPRESPAAAKGVPGANPDGGPLKPFWDFLCPPPSRKAPVAGAGELWPPADCWQENNVSVQFLIATVPDPTDSGFGYMFDQVVEAVQRALEMSGYVIDHAWLPWPRPGARKDKDRDPVRAHERQPGLILFRRDHTEGGATAEAAPRRHLLALFLVGETPTAGIHRAAFFNTVKLIEKFPGRVGQKEPLRVLGPFFSGSQVSLGLALREARDEKAEGPPVHVVCGSAMAFDGKQFFRTWQRDEAGDTFSTTILPDSLIRRWLYKFLDNPADPPAGTQPEPLVVLQEANTGFGQTTRQQGRQGLPGRAGGHGKRVFTVPFPLHVSQLRASYTKAQLARLETLGTPRPAWDMPLPQGDEEDTVNEVIPIQDPLMTTVLNSRVVDNVVQAMAQRRTRHVCLIATDARDKVFLASLIRDRFPDVQLCTTGSDLLLTHPDYRYALWGMVVGSTYPLHPTVQGWGEMTDKSDKDRIVFANQAFQGCYNATLIHLDGLGEREATAKMLDYGWGTEGTRPGIWLSAVGQNGQMVPLYYVSPQAIEKDLKDALKNAREKKEQDQVKDQQAQYERVYERRAPTRSFPWGTVALPNTGFLLFVAISLIVGALLHRAYDWIRRSGWDDTVEHLQIAFKQRIDFALAALAVIVLYYLSARLALVPVQYAGQYTDFWSWVASLIVVVASLGMMLGALACVVLVHWRKRSGAWVGWRERGREYVEVSRDSTPLRGCRDVTPFRVGLGLAAGDAVLFLACSGLTLYCLGAWGYAAFLSSSTPVPQELIDFERVAYATNGLSPLVPVFFLCAAVFAWGLFLVKKLYLASRFSVPCPFPEDGLKAFADIHKLDRDIRAELMPPSTWQQHPVLCLLVLGLLSIVFLKLRHEGIPPIDGEGFAFLTWVGFFVGSFLLIFTLCQVYLAWAKLRRLLRFLALLPMVDAFARLPDKAVAVFGHYLSSVRPRHSHLAIVVHLFLLFRRRFPAFRREVQLGSANPGRGPVAVAQAATDFEKQFPEGEPDTLPAMFEQELDGVEERDYETPEAAPGGDRPTVEYLNESAKKSLAVLRSLWPAHSMEEAFGRPVRDAQPAAGATFLSLPEKHAVREWALAAEDFVAIHVVRYVSQFFVQLRNLLTSLTVGSLLLLLAAVVYPFRPQSLLLLVLTTLCGAVAVFIVIFLVQVNRDELISRITRGTPNRFTPDLGFLHGAMTYVLPIVGGLMVQFPFVTSGLRSFFEPLLHIVH